MLSKKKVYFMGLLANTDSTIVGVKLKNGFKIKEMPGDKGTYFISMLEELPPIEVSKKLFINFPCLHPTEKKLYFVENCFECIVEIDDKGKMVNFPSAIARFSNESVRNYLDSAIRLMRLFKEGNIYLPLAYYYFIEKDRPKSFIRTGYGLYQSNKPEFTLGNSELPILKKFIKNTKIPFKEEFLQLAFENFELSYQTHNQNLQFLSSMIALETLFNPSNTELSYRISRNVAVLLGKDESGSNKIFSEVKNLYEKRSKIVHAGKSNIISGEELLKLRYYVRQSIKEIAKINKNKDELLNMLNSSGFGRKSWIKSR